MFHMNTLFRRSPARLVLPLAAVLGFAAPRLEALVINEVLYHSADQPDDRPWEFIELYNENADPLDLSGYAICNGVNFTFPPGTWLEGRSYLVVCADASNIASRYGISNVVGDWFVDPLTSGSLNNGGERIDVCNPGGRTIATVRFNDRGKWPVGADGTGHSLALRSPFTDPDDPDSWALSLELGGTPGRSNGFATDGTGGPPPAQGLDGAGFVLRWLALGPYTGSRCGLGVAALQRDWLRESAGGVLQTNLFWAEDQVVDTNYALAESLALHVNAGTPKPTVKAYVGATDTINLNDSIYPPDPNQVMAYAFCYVDNVTAAPLSVRVACASDDAISVMLNGVHVHTNDACRGVGSPGEVQDRSAPTTLAVGKNLVVVKVFEDGGGWSFRLRFENATTLVPLTDRSVIQTTLDYSLGLDFGGGGTPIEPTDPPPPPPDPGEVDFPVIVNEALFRTSGQRWIELYNRSNAPVSLAGFHLTDDPLSLAKATLGAGVSIAAKGYLSFTDTALGLDFSITTERPRVFDRYACNLVDRHFRTIRINYYTLKYP